MSSAGQAIGGLVGGVIGFFVGGPTGAYYGAQIGLTVGGALDPPKGPTLRGPRLEDLSVQTSTYGAFIPRNYGTVPILGNVFWLKGDKLTEVKKVTKSGGKGGPTQTTETFSYYATFAVGLQEGPIEGVRRIWIGGQLWYDAGSDTEASVEASAKLTIGSTLADQSTGVTGKFTLYKGTETQTADPLIQADKGAANVPAYRGLAYIVFEDLPLEKYSNSLLGAQVKVETVSSGTYARTLSLKNSVGTNHAANGSYSVAVYRKYAYVAGDDGDGTGGTLAIFDISNPASLVRVGTVDIGFGPWTVEVFGKNLYVLNQASRTLQTFSLSTPRSPVITSGVSTDTTPTSVYVSGAYDYVTNHGSNTLQVFYRGLLSYSVTTAALPRTVVVSGDYAYIISESASVIQIFSLTNPLTPVLTGSVATGTGPWHMVVAGNYLYVVTVTARTLQIFDIANPAAPVLAGSVGGFTSPYAVSVSGNHAYIVDESADLLYVVDVSNPAAPSIVAQADTKTTASHSNPYDVVTAGNYAYVVNRLSFTLQAFFFTGEIINPVSPALSAIVQSECLKSKLLTAADIDVSELADTVRGYRISQLGAIRTGLEPLRAAWPFDVVQTGYKIKFKKRGSASVSTVPAADLDARQAGNEPGIQIADVREMDIVLPRKVSVSYFDFTREYDSNMQSAERQNTDAVNESVIELPIVLTATEAAGKAETLLYLYWLERYDVSFTLPPTYAALEPGDVITVQATYANYSLRLTHTDHLSDGRVACRAKYNSASIYTPASQGAEGQSAGSVLTIEGQTVYALLDIPLIRDDDDTAGFPVAMSGYYSGWPGGTLFRTDDGGQSWSDLVSFASPGSTFGYALGTLGVFGSTVYDLSSQLTVRMHQGTLESVTETQLFTGKNWFAYGEHGRWEIIAARLATLQSDGSYILRDFLRGQMGTEWATGLHAVGDTVVELDAAALEFLSVNASTIGAERVYRGITSGYALDSDDDRGFTYTGVNLECLSPVHLTGHRTSGDWTLTWVRRSRFSGWRDYVDALLGEASESYSVDVFSDSTYATVKRTLTSTTPGVTYTSADQTTDFGATQSTLYLKIYQISATVGRGFPLTSSISRIQIVLVSLLHFDGADGSTTFTDVKGLVWTASGSAQIDTAISKFGGSAGLFPGGAADYISTPSNAEFAFGTGDFTVEAFIYLPVAPTGSYAAIADIRDNSAGTGSVMLAVNSSRQLVYYAQGTTTTSSNTVPLTTWTHVTICRAAGTCRLFIDGVLGATVTDTASKVAQPCRIGRVYDDAHAAFNGSIDEWRVTKGDALYIANFTPPSAAFPDS